MTWSKEEIEVSDIKTRKFLTMHGGFHPSAAPSQCTGVKEGGQGLVNIRATIQNETTKFQEYIRKMAHSDECLRLLKPRKGEEEEELSIFP